MQNFRNYYEILGISRDATTDEIKQAYRQLARQYHPDLNPGDKAAEEQFKLLGEAYEVLSDREKRSQYESFSRYWKQKGFKGVWGQRSQSQRANGQVSLDEIEFKEFEDFDNFVDQLLKRHRTKASAQPPTADPYRPGKSKTAYKAQPPRPSRRDAEADLVLPLEKAYTGGRERIRLEDGRSLEVDMPPGMVTGQRIRLRGQGISGGSLYLRIEVEPHPYFELQDGTLFCQVPITPSEATLGGTIRVPTLDGPVNMLIPPGVQPGQRLRLEGKGYPMGRDRRGDQIVRIEIVIPTVLSDEEKALYEELRQIEAFEPRANLPV
ncbi:J domain-containing protein [Romeria aff. gracilis LEGE 07310]|uniref:J domain-containing protein n=1 Tax=Vasconcelosia minhoensis LEGE 07310 TaxID=915328 RepID=A0A8J7DCE2_9CYAN|nr:J domain-containing protein [Romeria gracilis]MBE9078802.1 J domain-containing protein [Romeria aff. gracilis LEGE 07310]